MSFLFFPPNVKKLKAKRNVPGLIKALSYKKDADVRGVAAWALGKIGDARAVEPLITALKDSGSGVRERAARALGEIGDARALEPLIAVLKDSDSDARKNATEALGEIGDARAVEPLIAVLKDSYEYIRRNAAEALGKIGDARAVEPLIAALKDSDLMVQRIAAEALGKIGWQPTDGNQRALRAVVLREWDLAVREGIAAVEPLITALKGSNADVRAKAAGALEKIGWQPTDGNQRALRAVVLREWDLAVREGAAAVEPLITALKGEGRLAPHTEGEEKVKVITALQNILEHAGSSIGSHHLISIAQLDFVTYRHLYSDNCGNMAWDGRIDIIDCSQLRQLARQELIRRGEQA